jgi:Mrp family chromosome partitioning ATPase
VATAFWQTLREVRPSLRTLARGLVVAATEDPDAGHFELLGAKLLHQLRSRGWRRIGIASVQPGCGATTVTLNLAFGLAQQAELRVLLIEADLARPSIGTVLGLGPAAGFADLVEGRAEPAQALLRLRSNLAAVVAPTRAQAVLAALPALLAEEAVERLESLLEPNVTLIDLPPLLGGEAAALAGELVDGVLLVAAAGMTTIPEVEAAQRELLAEVALVGVVLNRCRDLGVTDGPFLVGQRRRWWSTGR